MSNIPKINQKRALLEKPKKGVLNSGFKINLLCNNFYSFKHIKK